MWVFRELARLLFQIAFAASIAMIIAGLWALVSGDFFDNLRIMFLLFGGLLILLAGGGNRATTTSRRLSWGIVSGIRGYGLLSPAFTPRPGQPTLTASAVFVGSGAVLLFLGMLS
jgi:hypothetical protein